MLDMPLNHTALRVLKGWDGIRKSEYVFYNPETGSPWKRPVAGFEKGLQTRWNARCHLAHLPAHVRFASKPQRGGFGDRDGVAGHSDVKTTRRYAHTNREAKRSAVAPLGVTLVTSPQKQAG